MTSPDPLERTPLTFLLGMAFQLVLTEFVAKLDAIGYDDLRPIHGLVFQLLQGPGATSTELAGKLGVTKQAAGQIIDYLEQAGYVERRPYPLGGRRKLVVLTDRGRDHMRVAGRSLNEIESRLAANLDDEGLGALRQELARMIRSLAGDDVPPLRPVW